MNLQKRLFSYAKSLGVEVHTQTKARGHQGFCLLNRIDISKNTPKDRIIPIFLHEFSHYIHAKIEKDVAKTGGTLEKLFYPCNPKTIEAELLEVTHFVDKHSTCETLIKHREQIKSRIKKFDEEIKKEYPNFQRSKKFKEFDKFIKHSKAKYLLKYDRIKLISRWLRRVEIYSIDEIEVDFPEMPKAFASYIRLKSLQRKQSRITSRINRYNKYYEKPTELFARFVEGLYLDENMVKELAPIATETFYNLLECGYYLELVHVFKMLSKNEKLGNF